MNIMKKRNKILLIILIVIAVIAGGAYCTYKFYLEPVVLEKTLEKAQAVLNDEKVQSEVEKFVEDMVQSGVLQDSDLKEYIDYKAKEEAAKAQKEQAAAENNGSGSGSNSGGSLNPGGAKNGGNTAAENGGAVQTEAPKPTPAPTNQPKKTLMERVKESMTADEFSFAMSIYGKIDVNYVLSNINSNREEVKDYVKSHLSGSEISKSLNIYAKYSYLLSE